MTIYNIIRDQLSLSGIHLDNEYLQQSDIVEYMVLEAVGLMPSMQSIELKTEYQTGYHPYDTGGLAIRFHDGKQRSTLGFGIKNIQVGEQGEPLIAEQTKVLFKKMILSIWNKFIQSKQDTEGRFWPLCSFFMLDEDIEYSIRSSSLFIAAGDLSQFSLQHLLMLKKKINLYKINDNNISTLVDNLSDKITAQVNSHFDAPLIQESSEAVEKEFAAQQAKQPAIAAQKLKFNQLIFSLDAKINDLHKKGTEAFPDTLLGGTLKNNDFIPAYAPVARAADELQTSVENARREFYKSNSSLDDVRKFESALTGAINKARGEFSKFRGENAWYNDLNPIFKGLISCCKALVGIIAGVTVVPALLTEKYSQRGYLATFFQTKPDSLHELELFEKGVCGKEGIIHSMTAILTA